jgi:hypothetical protein
LLCQAVGTSEILFSTFVNFLPRVFLVGYFKTLSVKSHFTASKDISKRSGPKGERVYVPNLVEAILEGRRKPAKISSKATDDPVEIL